MDSATDARRKRIGDAIYLLAHAALKNDWGEMQRAQQIILRESNDMSLLNDDLRRILAGYDNLICEVHCVHCGEYRSKHVATNHGTVKCLFDASEFKACEHKLPPLVITNIKAKNKINAIKELRAWGGLGLKDSKDIIESEARHHGW